MQILDSGVDGSRAQAPHPAVVAALAAAAQRLAAAGDRPAAGAPPTAGKWSVAQRLGRLLDVGSPYLALSSLAGGIEPSCTDGAGLATGIGQVRGTPCVVIANDWQHKAGSYQPATLAKHLRAQAIAERERLPCIYLVDSAGIYLPKQAELFAGEQHFGRLFANQARMSARGIPQLAVVLGMCTAGGAYVPAMADETILLRGQGTIFLAGPALVKAATGEEVSAEVLGGADTHGTRSGLVDHVADSEEEALQLCRDAVAALGPATQARTRRVARVARRAGQAPRYAMADVATLLPGEPKAPLPMRALIARLIDDSAWHPFKEAYGIALLCGFAHLEGQPLGIVANDGLLDGPAAQKGAHFVSLCDQRGVPLLFLQHTTGFVVGAAAEAAGIAKDGAKLVQAVACARVPRITVLLGASHGAGNYAMSGRGLLPNFVFAWPTSRISVMGPEQAASTMATLTRRRAERAGHAVPTADQAALEQPLKERYEREASASYATSQLWDDGLVLPSETRRTVALALAICRRPPAKARRAPVVRQ